jgi:hypothetical protein
MRGRFSDQGRIFSYLPPEDRVPGGHPLRAVRVMVRTVLEELHGDFTRLYSSAGRPSIQPDQHPQTDYHLTAIAEPKKEMPQNPEGK